MPNTRDRLGQSLVLKKKRQVSPNTAGPKFRPSFGADKLRANRRAANPARDQGPRTKDKEPRARDEGPSTKGQGPRTEDQAPRTKDQEPRTKDEGRRTKGQGPRTNQGPRTKDRQKHKVVGGRTEGAGEGRMWAGILFSAISRREGEAHVCVDAIQIVHHPGELSTMHSCSSGRTHRCHRCSPDSIPG